jgi:AraC-like DNA-binding protein
LSPPELPRSLGLAILSGLRPEPGSAPGTGWPHFNLVPVDPPDLADHQGGGALALANVRKLLLFFDTNYHRPIGIKQAVDWVHLDRSYCARIFRQHTGTSMHDYLTAIRMQKARQLLLTSQLPVKAVASSVGFMDYATFAKRFHAENGTTPMAFRAKPLSSEPRGKPR